MLLCCNIMMYNMSSEGKVALSWRERKMEEERKTQPLTLAERRPGVCPPTRRPSPIAKDAAALTQSHPLWYDFLGAHFPVCP